MSFSAEVKSELRQLIPESRHCQIAEIAAFSDLMAAEGADFALRADRRELWDLLFTLFQRAFNIELDARTEDRKSILLIPDPEDRAAVRAAASHGSVLRMECCRRAYLRGAFLAGGSVSAPEKSYHFEITAASPEKAEKICQVMQKEGLDARVVLRKKDYVVYLKEADQIVTILGIMGASISFLNLENVRIVKDMRGRINRSINCESANLDRTINSAYRQQEEIRLIAERKGLSTLPPGLREIAELRLAYPEASFAELGKMADPQIGKSGVHHRLRKLGAIAADLRDEALEEKGHDKERSNGSD